MYKYMQVWNKTCVYITCICLPSLSLQQSNVKQLPFISVGHSYATAAPVVHAGVNAGNNHPIAMINRGNH